MSGHDFHNAFQIFNLNKDSTAMAILQHLLAYYAMDHRGVNLHALRRSFFETALQLLLRVHFHTKRKARIGGNLAIELILKS